MKRKYGNYHLVLKEDCVRQIQKRMGSNMRKYKIDVKEKLPNEGTVGSRGILTDAVTDNFHNYYGEAIRNNKNSVHKIKDAISVICYHCILCENEPLSQKHYLCLKDTASLY